MIKIKEDILNLKKDYEKIKNQGWIKSINKGSCGIGLTLENMLWKEINNLELPDYNSIEIKTKRLETDAYTTLFNCTPTGSHKKEIERLKNLYGYRNKDMPNYKVLRNSVYSKTKTRIGIFHYFQLKIDTKNEKVILLVFDIKGNLLITQFTGHFQY